MTRSPTTPHERLVDAIRTAPFFSRDEIREWEKPPELPADWLWNALIQSLSTWGSSRGFEGLQDEEVAAALRYEAVAAVPGAEREDHLREWFERAKFRYPADKAAYANDNFDTIESLGGVEQATELALAQSGYEAKLAFVTRFKGVGPKYGRNLWMDVRDPDFTRSIAVDQRLKNIASAVGIDSDDYDELETFYVVVADDLGITPWGLDRFLYRKHDEVLAWLNSDGTRPSRPVFVLVEDGQVVAVYSSRSAAEQARTTRVGTIVEVTLDPDHSPTNE